MISAEEAARLLTAEAEETIALLGGRLVGGGVRVTSVRLAVGQTGEVAEEQPFLLSEATEGRPGWAVEVRLDAGDVPESPTGGSSGEGGTPGDGTPGGGPPGGGTSASATGALRVVADAPCTVLRGVDDDTDRDLAGIGVDTVRDLADLPESRIADLLVPGSGLRLVDAWSRAQLLRVPLPAVDLSGLAHLPLPVMVAATPERLRAEGLGAGGLVGGGLVGEVPDRTAEEVTRFFTLLGAALDLRVLRELRVADLLPGDGP